MAIRTQDHKGAIYTVGDLNVVTDLTTADGVRYRRVAGHVATYNGIVRVEGYETTGYETTGNVRDGQSWMFEIVDPDRATKLTHWQHRTKRDFLTLSGAKRVAAKWARELWQ